MHPVFRVRGNPSSSPVTASTYDDLLRDVDYVELHESDKFIRRVCVSADACTIGVFTLRIGAKPPHRQEAPALTESEQYARQYFEEQEDSNKEASDRRKSIRG